MSLPTDLISPVELELDLISLLVQRSQSQNALDALGFVEPRMFSKLAHQEIWEAARVIAETGEQPNQHRILRKIDNPLVRGELEKAQAAWPSENWYSIGSEVKRCGEMRLLIAACQTGIDTAAHSDDPLSTLGKIQDDLTASMSVMHADRGDTWSETLAKVMHVAKHGDGTIHLATPWPELNDVLGGGLAGGRLYVFGARPGIGKSTVGNNIAQFICNGGGSAGVVSLEMSKLENGARMVAAACRVELSEMLNGTLSKMNQSIVADEYAAMDNWDMHINDNPYQTTASIRAFATKLKRSRAGLSVLVVDYLQLITATDKKAPRQEQVADISRAMKLLARELDVPVIMAAQLNREAVGRTPVMSDLRESGAIEQDADVIALLSRPINEDGTPSAEIHFNVDKNRHGRTGLVPLTWKGHYAAID